MKKLLFLLLMLPAVVFAAPISKERANAIGENFFSKSIEAHRIAGKQAHFIVQQQPNMKKVRQNTGNTYAPYYIFNNEGGGFVIVAGDDCATPILGYSTEGSINPNNLPIQLEELLNAYADEIQLAIENNDQATDSIANLWNIYNHAPQSQNATAVVNALITTSWNQAPYYNIKCPADASLSNLGGHPTTGCVATAMAQIMKYWEYPTQGTGYWSYKSQHYGTLSANFANTTYDWDNMPLKLSSSTSSTQNDAVATLMYHCGVAVEMEYNHDGTGSSGAQLLYSIGKKASSEYAFANYFGYASTLSGKKSSSMSASAWKSLLKAELDNQRPILYAGYNPNGGGHCFICDGYDSNDKFHFNWGWGGQANGFFSLTALTPSGLNYTEGQQAVIGIKPKDGSGPAKNYDLFMNTDLNAINTNNNSVDAPNLYYYGRTMSFTAKIENNGTGIFNGSFRVAAFTNDGEFVAWSNESYHFSLGAGNVTEKKTYTFDGGLPFITGRYRAYMYYNDDNETDWKLVKSDVGTFLTEYNNVVFTIKISSGDLVPMSDFVPDEQFGSFITGSKLRINVDVRNTALITTFYGKIRLNLYNLDGTRAQIIEELDYSNGFPSLTTKSLSFFNTLDSVTPGTYYLALVYQKPSDTLWYWMRSTESYPNPIRVNILAPTLQADDNEPNNTQSNATLLNWEIDDEMEDFGTLLASFHNYLDVDYYKMVFPEANKYTIDVHLHDKFNQGGHFYANADAQWSYSIGGNSYSDFYKDDITITLNGPSTLYFKVQQYGLNGLGYYELFGDIEEISLEALENVEVEGTASKILRNGSIFILRGDRIYTITGQKVK